MAKTSRDIFATAAVVKNKKVFLFHRLNYDVWEFPCGNIEFGEHPSETAGREVKEETGLDVKVEKLLAIGSIVRPDKIHEITFCYLCRLVKENAEAVIGDEDHDKFKWVTLGEIKKIKNLACSVQAVLKEVEEIEKYLKNG